MAALSCALFGTTATQSNAAVVVTFEQVGADVVASWNGTIDLGVWSGDGFAIATSSASTDALLRVTSSADRETFGGGEAELTGLGPSFVTGGTLFGGFSGTTFQIAGVDDNMAVSGLLNFSGETMIFDNTTLAALNADNFANTLAWTSSVGGLNTVSYTSIVPEPSSTILTLVASVGLLSRRKR